MVKMDYQARSCKTQGTPIHLSVDGLVCPAKDTTSVEIFQDYFVRAPQDSISDFKFINFTIRAKAKANIPRNYHGHLRVQ
uniref:Uncharacterized protein n=1 Tax=Romanomermis culicivorax TaxID=13658 RepID=A0A915L3V5_ROMCU